MIVSIESYVRKKRGERIYLSISMELLDDGLFFKRLKHFWLSLAPILLVLFLSANAFADTIVRSFNAKGSIQPGWVVALKAGADNTVELAPANDPGKIYGVVVDPSDAPLTVQKQNEQVFVATSGTYSVIVSTQNGTIKSGDYLSIGSTDGIAAKADSKQSFILGRALEAFDGHSGTIVKANDGTALGRISVQVSPAKNPLLKEAVPIPQPLRQISQSIAGRSVSGLRIYAGLAVFLIAALLSVILMTSGVRNAMIAIGRNPLSRHGILKSLMVVIGAAASVLFIGLLGVYLLLKL